MITLNKEDISSILPHKDPFLFVESISISKEQGVVEGKGLWDENNMILNGHFPSKKIVPGVLLIECAAQIAGTYYIHNSQSAAFGVLSAVKKSIFYNAVYPNEIIDYQMKIEKINDNTMKVIGDAYKNATKVFSYSIFCSIYNDI